jgi:hypothetical protein
MRRRTATKWKALKLPKLELIKWVAIDHRRLNETLDKVFSLIKDLEELFPASQPRCQELAKPEVADLELEAGEMLTMLREMALDDKKRDVLLEEALNETVKDSPKFGSKYEINNSGSGWTMSG